MNDNPPCPWCGKPVLFSELSAQVDGKTMHFNCAAEEEDDAFFDRDMEFGS